MEINNLIGCIFFMGQGTPLGLYFIHAEKLSVAWCRYFNTYKSSPLRKDKTFSPARKSNKTTANNPIWTKLKTHLSQFDFKWGTLDFIWNLHFIPIEISRSRFIYGITCHWKHKSSRFSANKENLCSQSATSKAPMITDAKQRAARSTFGWAAVRETAFSCGRSWIFSWAMRHICANHE
jgi:hypothetical protein